MSRQLEQPRAACPLTATEREAIASRLRLSRREQELTALIVQGASESHIAERLCLSQHTVHTYITRLYRKAQVGSKAAFVSKLFDLFVGFIRCYPSTTSNLLHEPPLTRERDSARHRTSIE